LDWTREVLALVMVFTLGAGAQTLSAQGKPQEVFALKGHTNLVYSVAFTPDGKRLASGGLDEMVKVWDSDKGHEILSFQGHSDGVTTVRFSPDGKRIATCNGALTLGSTNIVKVWEVSPRSK
jgi:WD40 repeat protein